uniref:NADH-ubiquinone oxidoreductase chain 6 n=1 Tax=Luciola curtithorax TaxID=1453194 RepID=A0A344AQM3_9COLE|nr:NADH dehydrogenase subunit 6 [Luciola curtithorax]AWW89612.1 NADH dehydrogenase subunit 6 [Luciola curtithorax]
MTMIILMMTTTLTLMFITHPLSMGMILLIQTLLIAMWTGFLSMNFWYSYILFIVMVGGMLILFIYMTSVASNEKFSYSKILLMFMMIMLMMSIMLMIKDQFFSSLNSSNLEMMNMKNKYLFKLSLNKFYMFPMMLISLSVIIYLLITLIAVVKITNLKSGPLRKNI